MRRRVLPATALLALAVLAVFGLWRASFRGAASDHRTDAAEALERYPYQVTRHGKDSHPLWSPNGKTIAFRSLRETYSPRVAALSFELWIAGADGSGESPLISRTDPKFGGRAAVTEFSWFPDSQSLLCIVEGNRGIWRVFLNGSKDLLVSAHSGGRLSWFRYAQPSPDGTKIAFTMGSHYPSTDQVRNGLYVADARGSNRICLAEGFFGGLTWAPDGTRIIYAGREGETGKNDLWEVAIDGGKAIRLSKTPTDAKAPSCSPDGRNIIYHVDEGGRSLYVTPRSDFRPKRLVSGARDGGGVRHMGWMPDGQHALISQGGGIGPGCPPGSWLIDLEGHLVERLEGAAQCLSPDGQRYCFSVSRQHPDLKIAGPDGPIPDWESNLWIGKIRSRLRAALRP